MEKPILIIKIDAKIEQDRDIIKNTYIRDTNNEYHVFVVGCISSTALFPVIEVHGRPMLINSIDA